TSYRESGQQKSRDEDKGIMYLRAYNAVTRKLKVGAGIVFRRLKNPSGTTSRNAPTIGGEINVDFSAIGKHGAARKDGRVAWKADMVDVEVDIDVTAIHTSSIAPNRWQRIFLGGTQLGSKVDNRLAAPSDAEIQKALTTDHDPVPVLPSAVLSLQEDAVVAGRQLTELHPNRQVSLLESAAQRMARTRTLMEQLIGQGTAEQKQARREWAFDDVLRPGQLVVAMAEANPADGRVSESVDSALRRVEDAVRAWAAENGFTGPETTATTTSDTDSTTTDRVATVAEMERFQQQARDAENRLGRLDPASGEWLVNRAVTATEDVRAVLDMVVGPDGSVADARRDWARTNLVRPAESLVADAFSRSRSEEAGPDGLTQDVRDVVQQATNIIRSWADAGFPGVPEDAGGPTTAPADGTPTDSAATSPTDSTATSTIDSTTTSTIDSATESPTETAPRRPRKLRKRRPMVLSETHGLSKGRVKKAV